MLACGAAKDKEPDRSAGEHARSAQPARSLDDYQRHADQVRKRIARQGGPATEFHIVVERPFVIIGDEPPAMVEKRASRTVRWAVKSLQAAYFAKEPLDIIEVWLFRDIDSYQRNTKRFFGDTPDTPYGYYSPTHRALIMNIATGGGTLIHEIVHPYMSANFPDCPAWFNEGMGSLYEQSSERDGDIIGLTNWRLEGLQEALHANRVPSFATLMATTDTDFYDRDPGSNYAQARYLMYYLQEKGLLHDYYRRYVASAAEDPTGYATLQTVLGTDDMDGFFKTWRAFVLQLTFP